MIERPPGIDCVDWELSAADPRKRRCRYYADGGICGLPSRLVCSEWQKRNLAAGAANPTLAMVPDPLALPDPLEPPRMHEKNKHLPIAAPGEARGRVLVDTTLSYLHQPSKDSPKAIQESAKTTKGFMLEPVEPKPKKAAEVAREIMVGAPPQNEVTVDFTPVHEIPKEDIEALEKMGAEITLDSPATEDGKPIVIVPAYTDQDRNEVSYRDMSTIRLLVDAFPGAHVTKFKRPPRSNANQANHEETRECALSWGGDPEDCACKGVCPNAEKLIKERQGR